MFLLSRRLGRSWLALLCLLGAGGLVEAQTPGDNVNMVSGTTWPGGDPFLQRQNEPSLAVSSRNSLHLLAGANDYRTVDLPATDVVPGELAGDAWLGIFKSFDGGSRWQSTLLPGYPQDTSTEGLASPLKAYQTAADPTVRAGTHGLLYMSGIAFNRGTNNGGVFVTTFFDQNNKENGNVPGKTDPLRYLRTVMVDTGTSGQFLDKPWIAVDLPRAGAAICSIPVSPGETVPAGNLYLVWSRFTGSQSTKIMLSRSLDCGRTWSNPIKLSESNSVNQGTVLAVNPLSGAVYVTWRRFASSSEQDAILFAKSTDFGKTFAKATEIAPFIPFDQQTSTGSFRTSALPTLAVSVSGAKSFLHVAFSAREAAGGDARIKISTSDNEGTSWSGPVNVEPLEVVDDFGNPFTRGHQFMPQLTFSAGKLMLLYYDQRLDHTVGLFEPQEPFGTVLDGKFYEEKRDPRGELPAQPDSVFKPTLDDTGLLVRRHTVDLRVAQSGPGAAPIFASAAVSRYRFGIRGDGEDKPGFLEQLELNPPNLPLFQQGSVPFLGDYVDIAGQAFLPPATPGEAWRFNIADDPSPVHYATWTSNQDVRAPADGDWTNYTPIGGGGASIYDPNQTTPPCQSGQAGMRNQNVYLSRITQGLLVTTPQNTKRLSPTTERALVVQVQNSTGRDRVFRLALSNLPGGVAASFVSSASAATCPFPSPTGIPCTALDVSIPARSSIARSVFVKSSAEATQILVKADEIAAVGAAGPLPSGLSGSVLFNPEGTAFDLAQPDGGSDPDGGEIYTPSISSANVSNANVSNANVSNANVSNANVSNANVSNANVSNAHIANFDLADANVSNANVSNANVSNANVSNANVSNANISNAPLSDATFTVVNDGNTTHSFHVKLVGQAPSPTTALQLIIQKPYATPTALGCDLVVEPRNALVANIVNPTVGDPDGLFDPNIPDSSPGNATLVLEPGQSASVTLRGAVEAVEMVKIANRVFPRIIAHAGNNSPNEPYADPLVISSESDTLPAAVLGVPYSATLHATGGKPPFSYTWTLAPGSPVLPPSLSLSAGGLVSGTPQVSGLGETTVVVQVQDTSTGQKATQELTFVVAARPTTTSLTPASASAVVGQAVAFTVTVADPPSGTQSPLAGEVTLVGTPGLTVQPSSCTFPVSSIFTRTCSVTATANAVVSGSLTATYSGDATHTGSSGVAALVVGKAATTTTITGDTPDPSNVGQSVTVTVAVAAAAPGSGTPAGSITIGDGSLSCAATLVGGSGTCSLTFPTAGTRTLTATYAGDGVFTGSSDTEPHQVAAPLSYTFLGYSSPLATAGTLALPSSSGQASLGSAIPIKWQIKNGGVYVTTLGAVTSLQAIRNGSSCPGPKPPAGPAIQLYSPAAGTPGGSSFKYDTGSNTYQFNWDTSKGTPAPPTAGCYWLVLQLGDGSDPKVTTIKLK